MLHFGTHGSLEFMPGKQVGMSGVCYPDSLIGSIPNLYYYAANNPSEATIAKRRSYANTISYLTPPAENAGLYKGLKVGAVAVWLLAGAERGWEMICNGWLHVAWLVNAGCSGLLPGRHVQAAASSTASQSTSVRLLRACQHIVASSPHTPRLICCSTSCTIV